MGRANDTTVRLAAALLLAGYVVAQAANGGTTTAAGANNNQQTTAAQQTNAPAPTTTGISIAITGVPTASTSTTSSGTSTSPGTFGGLSDLPTIAGYGIPTMVVPWTQGAPFMQSSNAPEGTIFICVGALLGFLGIAILSWRAIVAWSISRSVKRANEKQLYHPENAKYVKPGVGGANMAMQNVSKASMDYMNPMSGNTLTKKSNTPTRSNIASANPTSRQSSLFFSPTAGATPGNTSSMYMPNNRSSSFLPSGYYAAPGAGSPAGGATATHIGSGSNRYSQAQRQSRYQDVSPPDTPGLPPSSRGLESRGTLSSIHGHGMYHQPSTSSLNLNLPGNAHSGGRVPSANLDDMLDDYPLPRAR